MTPPKAPRDATAARGNPPSAGFACPAGSMEARPGALPASPAPAGEMRLDAVTSASAPPASMPVAAAPHSAAASLITLTERADFLRAARALRQGTGSMMVQARARQDDSAAIRVGFTCSKKVGNAVARNRAKRRLRAAARAVLPALARPGWDYVLIGRAEATAARPFDALCDDLAQAVQRLNARG